MTETLVLCPECGKELKHEMALKVHLTAYHKKERKPVVCTYCGRPFKSEHSLKIHKGLMHDPLSALNVKKSLNTPNDHQTGDHQNGINILPIDSSKFYYKDVPAYVEQSSEIKLLKAHWDSGVPLLFVGPKGVGKTLSIASFAKSGNIPIIQFDCSEDTKRWDLLGRFVDIGTFELGVLPTAFEVANKEKRCILVFEELNSLNNYSQKVLNQILDWRRHVYVPEINRTYNLDADAKLLIVATMNPRTYGGTFELNEDLRSRFAEFFITYPKEEVERQVVSIYGSIPDQLLKGLLTFAKESRSDQVSYAISPRDLSLFAQVYKFYQSVLGDSAERYALLTTIVNRYTPEEVENWVKPRLMSIFGHELVDTL